MARRAAWATGVGSGVAMLAAGASVWGSAVVAPPAVHDGRLAGVMVAVIVLLPLAAFEALVPLPQAAVLLTRVRSAARRLFGLLDEAPAVNRAGQPAALPERPYTIELRRASARWTSDGPRVLDDLDLTVSTRRTRRRHGQVRRRKVDAGRRVAPVPRSRGPGHGAAQRHRRVPTSPLTIFAMSSATSPETRTSSRPTCERISGWRSHEHRTASWSTSLYRVRLGEWYDGPPGWARDALGRERRLDFRRRASTDRIGTGPARRSADTRPRRTDRGSWTGRPPPRSLADLLDSASGRTVLMLTHRDEGLDLVDRHYCLVDGRLVADRRLPADAPRFRFTVGASGGHPTRVMSVVPVYRHC